MPPTREKLRTFNIFLLKESITKYEEALTNHDLKPKFLVGNLDFVGQLYIEPRDHNEPDWLKFLRTGVGEPIEAFSSSSLAVILFIKTAKRIFALTFGLGRHLLDSESYERRFGLKVVVNRVAPDKIGSMDLKKFEDVVVKRREETSRDTVMQSFSVNTRQDMLRGVAGVPIGKTLEGLPGNSVERVGGSDSLMVHARVTFKQLGKLCRGALTASIDKAYTKRGFKWIDNLKAVTDITKIRELDEVLIQELRAKHLIGIEMTLPDEIDTSVISGVTYTGDNTLHPKLDTNDWFRTIQHEITTMDADQLRHKRVKIYGPDPDVAMRTVSAYECLNFEPQGNATDRFILANGEWFEVRVTFDQEIQTFIDQISTTKVDLPDALAGEDEPAYITRISKLGKLHCIHPKTFMADGGPVEFCDLLSISGQLIHLKLWTSSATFSHLLSQGAISAETLVRIPDYRKSVFTYLQPLNQPLSVLFSDNGFIRDKMEVVFGLIRSSSRRLPFFSRLNLTRMGERVQLLGYRVGFKRIPQ